MSITEHDIFWNRTKATSVENRQLMARAMPTAIPDTEIQDEFNSWS